jgi:hypothetical protein
MIALIEMLKGKKTYIVAIATAVLGVLQTLGVWQIPAEAWPFIVAAGFGGLRDAIDSFQAKVEAQSGGQE